MCNIYYVHAQPYCGKLRAVSSAVTGACFLDNRVLADPGASAFQVRKYPFYLLNRLVSRYNVVIEALSYNGCSKPTSALCCLLPVRAMLICRCICRILRSNNTLLEESEMCRG